ncbi:MAG TPA: MBL fold metallo-hydrolase [Thermoanaerobaculia bacterium]|jgi:glyoxylase-like metal-dependent hydrolase (beta-lactamase superfamily II)
MNIRTLRAPNPGPFTLDGTQTYLLGETAVLDPGPDIASHVDAIRAAMPRLDTILITHRHADHAPAALPLKAATGARIIAPRNVLDEVDRRISGGETIAIEGEMLEVIATPGHTNEHVCFLSSQGDLFTGDTILGTGTTTIFPPDGHMGDYLRSLRTLRARDPKRIYPAHGPIRENAAALIDEYIAHRLERERQVLDAMAAGATTPAEMRARIYPQLDERLHQAAEIQIEAHLMKLREEGAVGR